MARSSRAGIRLCIGGIVSLLWLVGAAGHVLAQTTLTAEAIARLRSSKPPEEWTLEERLAARFNPEDIRGRFAADREEQRKNRSSEAEAAEEAPSVWRNSVVGRRNPELFLPTELFEHLIELGYHQEPKLGKGMRTSLEQALLAEGLQPESFWSALESVAQKTIQAHKDLLAVSAKFSKTTATERKELSKKSDEAYLAICGPRAADLAAARKYFGRKVFDHFLYHGVAPGCSQVTRHGTEQIDQLVAMEGGCHESQ